MLTAQPFSPLTSFCCPRWRVFGWLLVAVIGLGWFGTGYAEDESELLPEDQAFGFHAELLPDQQLEVRWDIADGYYMYRDKMVFEVLEGNALAAPLVLPKGKPKVDALFGDVDVYTDQFSMRLPLASDSTEFTLLVNGQGCNEPVGVCYPPMEKEIRFDSATSTTMSVASQSNLDGSAAFSTGSELFNAGSMSGSAFPGSISSSSASSPGDRATADELPTTVAAIDGTENHSANSATVLDSANLPITDKPKTSTIDSLRNLVLSGFDQPEFLAVDDAFKLTIAQTSATALQAHFDVADGYYLYRDKIRFTGSGSAKISNFELPAGVAKDDANFGRSMVFMKSFSVPISLAPDETTGGPITIDASYQGCAVDGICYPPVTKAFDLQLLALVNTATADTGGSGQQQHRTLLGILLGAIAAGVFLTFTPCVLPMIPILSSVIAGQGGQLTRWRGGGLAVVYVLGTAVTYAVMGAIAGATGEQLQAYFQNAWAIGILAAVFVLMALSMFGLFQLQVPAAIQSRLQSGSRNLTGSIPLVFALGLVSALIVGACVSPILISFLGLAMSRADPVLGAQMMFAMAIGMGLPLIFLGFGMGYLLPRAGPWMEIVKHLLGVMLIAVAIYLLGILPQVPVLLLWGAFLIILSSFVASNQTLSTLGSGWQRLAKGIGIILLVWGIAALIGGFVGERSLLRPIPAQLFQGTGSNISAPAEHALFTRVNSPAELDQQLSLASSSGRKVMIDFYADWCVDCIKMEQSTFRDPQVLNVLNRDYLALQVDVTDPNDPGPGEIKKRLGVFGPPAVLFFDSNGSPMRNRNFYGYKNPADFLKLIDG